MQLCLHPVSAISVFHTNLALLQYPVLAPSSRLESRLSGPTALLLHSKLGLFTLYTSFSNVAPPAASVGVPPAAKTKLAPVSQMVDVALGNLRLPGMCH